MSQSTLIVGGGLAGIVTALELLDARVPVTLLDRDHPENIGGLARWSFGGLFVVDSPQQRKLNIKDSPERAYQDWLSYAEFEPDDHLPRQWAEAYTARCRTEVYDWVLGKGLTFLPAVQWLERGLFQPGNSVPRFHMVWGLGKGLMHTLASRLLNHPNRHLLDLRFRHRVTDLVTAAGAVTGVIGVDESTQTPFEVTGAAVVIAAGGITGNFELLRKNWHPDFGSFPDTLLSGTDPLADGASAALAEQAGGRITHLHHQWSYAAGVHHPEPRFEHHGLSLVPPKSALWVNYQGKRIGPQPLVSGFDTRFLVERVARQEKQYSWQILNRKIAEKELAVSGSQYNDALVNQDKVAFIKGILLGNKPLVNQMIDQCIDFVVADNVADLTQKMNALTGTFDISSDTLRQQIEAFDAQVSAPDKFRNDDQLRRIAQLRSYMVERLRTCNRQPILDPGAGPLIAIREFILVRKTLGGIQTNLSCQVLNPAGTPIEGLYAVGEAAGFGGGGIHGKRALEGTFLGGCIFTGRVAAGVIRGE